MKKQEEIFFPLIDKERNIYECSELYSQNRKEVSEYYTNLINPDYPDDKLDFTANCLTGVNSKKTIKINDNVVSFIDEPDKTNKEWERLNTQFMNYHKSLSVYTMVNSMPLINYIALKSKVGLVKNKTVVDVGGRTGHTQCSFFQNPETIEYYLVYPNLRLMHDQFIRMFPKLTYLKMGHILAYAEKLPFVNDFADIVLSLAAVDHYKDYDLFIKDSWRILKKGGMLFVSSHLDIPPPKEDQTKIKNKLFSFSFFERLSRYIYYKKYKVGSDYHTFHFKDTSLLEESIVKAGFKIEETHVFKKNFYIIAYK